MQQAPEYREQDQLRREYVPQQPNAANLGQPAASAPAAGGTAAGRVAPVSWSDWVRWGPIWSGFFTILSTLAVLGALGTAIKFSVWGSSSIDAFVYGWSIMTGIIAYFLGGWIAARAAGVGGSGPAMLNAGLTWALSLVAILAVALFGLGNAFGFIGSNLTTLLRGPGPTSGSVATTAWVTFATLVIGLILALIGGLAGAHRMPEWRGSHMPGGHRQHAV